MGFVGLPRDDPLRSYKIVGDTITAKQKANILKKVLSYDKQFGVVQNLNTQEDIDYLISSKTCKSAEFYTEFMQGFSGCPLAAVCFTKNLPTFLSDTLEEHLKTRTVLSKTVKKRRKLTK